MVYSWFGLGSLDLLKVPSRFAHDTLQIHSWYGTLLCGTFLTSTVAVFLVVFSSSLVTIELGGWMVFLSVHVCLV